MRSVKSVNVNVNRTGEVNNIQGGRGDEILKSGGRRTGEISEIWTGRGDETQKLGGGRQMRPSRLR